MNNAKPIDLATIDGLSVNENASSAKDCQFIVEIVRNCMKEAKNSPMRPPTRPSIKASRRNVARMPLLRKPSARNVPISAVRLATDAYMVIIAPMVAPIEKMTDSVNPR